MPAIQKGEFAMVDHWIRVHPEQGAPTSHATAQRPSQEFLRIIVAASRENADAAKARLTQGEDFFDVAARVSIDASRDTGGFIGRATLADLDPRLADAAARLHYGQTSEILELPDRWMIVQRLPRDFRMDAQRLFLQAVDLKAKGNVRGALERDQAALKWNPSFLRALIFMGATLGESGQLQRAQNVLTVATQLFPKDSAALFNLGIVLGGLGKTDAQIQAFRHAIELDPDNVAVYESLGAALHAVGDSPGALETFRQGLQIDPLSAALNFDLSLELQQQGDQPSALQAKQLALRINPQLVPTVGK
jgi:tetratricopeptide (TPR) repeat protein